MVSVDYRLAPDHAFPAAIEDAYEALAWTIRGATSMGSDPSLVSVGGDGAGGNIAAAVAQMARDKGPLPLLSTPLSFSLSLLLPSHSFVIIPYS